MKPLFKNGIPIILRLAMEVIRVKQFIGVASLYLKLNQQKGVYY